VVITSEEIARGAAEPRTKRVTLDCLAKLAVTPEGAVQLSSFATVREQDLIESLALANLFRLEATGRFHPDEGTIALEVEELSLLDGAVAGTWSATLTEDGAEVGAIALRGHGAVKLTQLPVEVPGLSISDVDLSYQADDWELTRAGVTGRLEVRGRVGHASVARADGAVTLEDGRLEIRAHGQQSERTPTTADVDLVLDVGKLEAGADAAKVRLADVEARYTGRRLPLALVLPRGKEGDGAPDSTDVRLLLGEIKADADGDEIRVRNLALQVNGQGMVRAALRQEPISARIHAPIGLVRAKTKTGHHFSGQTI